MILKGSLALIASLVALVQPADDVQLSRQVTAYLTIKDYRSAITVAKESLKEHPGSIRLKEMLIRSLALDGRDQEALAVWEANAALFGKEQGRQLLEEVAWSTLSKASSSSSLLLRIYSMIGALLTQDMNAVSLLESQLSDSNRVIRSIALELSGYLGDEPLKQKVRERLVEERLSDVRTVLIRAAGRLRIKEEVPYLQKVVADSKSRVEEKAAAIESLVSLYDHVSSDEMHKLCESDRAGLRMLACELASRYECSESQNALLQLLDDPHAPVRASACRLFGLGVLPMQIEKVKALCQDPDPLVAITAIWSLYPKQPDLAKELIKPWLFQQNREIAVMASAALAQSGSAAYEQMVEVMISHPDPFVCANCAMGLIGLRSHVEEACDVLDDLLQLECLLMKQEVAGLTFIDKSTIRHHPLIPHFPEAQDQMTRLDLLNTLAVVHSPRAKEGLLRFLREKDWGVSGIAATTLLQEGDDSAGDLVRELLEDPNPHVRIQAALVLANWLKDKSALTVLQSAYGEVDREMRFKILEALGSLGDSDCLPFLLERLHEPFQAERIVAAFAIIRCLNH